MRLQARTKFRRLSVTKPSKYEGKQLVLTNLSLVTYNNRKIMLFVIVNISSTELKGF